MKTDLEDDLAANPTLKDAILEAAPEEERWNPIGGSQGRRNPPLHNDGEDEDGRSEGEQMVEAGVEAAEYDQMLEADKADLEKDELSDETIEKITDADIDILDRDTDELSEQGVFELDEDDDEDELDDDEENLLLDENDTEDT